MKTKTQGKASNVHVDQYFQPVSKTKRITLWYLYLCSLNIVHLAPQALSFSISFLAPQWREVTDNQRRLHIPGQRCLKNHQFFRITGVQLSNLNISKVVSNINELLSNYENLVF